jgi:hypothetical protein
VRRAVLVVALDGVEGRFLGGGLLHGALLDQLVGRGFVLQLRVQLRLEHVLLDVAGVVLEAGLLAEAEEVLLELGVVGEVALARLGDQLLVDAALRRALLVVGLDLLLLFVGEGLGETVSHGLRRRSTHLDGDDGEDKHHEDFHVSLARFERVLTGTSTRWAFIRIGRKMPVSRASSRMETPEARFFGGNRSSLRIITAAICNRIA